MERIFWLELLASLLNVHFILISLLNGEMRKKLAVIIFLLISPLSVLAYIFADDPAGKISVVCGTVLCYIAPLLTVSGVKKSKIAYTSLLYFAVSNVLFVSCRWIMRILAVTGTLMLIIDVVLQLFLISICVVFLRNSVFYRAKQYIDVVPVNLRVLLLVSVWAGDVLALFFSAYTSSYPRTLQLILTEMSAVAIILLVGILWPFILVGSSLNASYKAALDKVDRQMQAQVKQYELVIRADEDLRKFKHDFNNLKVGLAGHLQNGDAQGALQFLEACERSVQPEYIAFNTGNWITDALLSDKQASAKDILIHFDGMIPNSGISSIDLCVILGNLIDNALEACKELEAAQAIDISSSMNNGFLHITVSNPVKEDIVITGNIPGTTKRDKENHGIGLLSINNAIKKYDGVMKLACVEKVFTVEISLDLNGQ